MGYLQLFGAALMWSLVGVLVKTAAHMVDSGTISLCRFLFGCVFLGLLMRFQKVPIRLLWRNQWIWIGVAAKSLSYLCEITGIRLGFVYGGVIVVPVQTMFLALASILFFGEELTSQKTFAFILCVAGVFLVSWKGASLAELFKSNFLITGLFILTGLGAAIHIMCQKKLLPITDTGNMNLSMFLWSASIVALPLPLTFKFSGGIQPLAVISLISLGIITGFSFYLYAEALKKVSFFIAGLVGNSSVLFTLLWSKLFFKENINGFVMVGAILMVAGLIIINLPQGPCLKVFRNGVGRSNPSHKSD